MAYYVIGLVCSILDKIIKFDLLEHDCKCLRLDVQNLDGASLISPLGQAAEKHGLEHGRGHCQEHSVATKKV